MRLAGIRAGDLVLVDKRGTKFHALVTGAGQAELTIEPLARGLTWRTARPREVLVHWRRAGRTRPARRPDHSDELSEVHA